jgi:hypothetical protein
MAALAGFSARTALVPTPAIFHAPSTSRPIPRSHRPPIRLIVPLSQMRR